MKIQQASASLPSDGFPPAPCTLERGLADCKENSMGERLEQVLRARKVRKVYPLALELGVNESCISRWRRDGAISTDNAIRLCRILDVSLDWLLCGRGQMDQHKGRSISDEEYAVIEALRLLPGEARHSILNLFAAIDSRLDNGS